MSMMKRARYTLAVLTVLLGMMIVPVTVAWAQSGTASTAETKKAKKQFPPGFEPVAGAPDVEKIDASKLVIGAYAAFFMGMFGYIVMVAKKQTDIAKEMESLASRINKAGQ